MIILLILFLAMLVVFLYGSCEIAGMADDDIEEMFWNWKGDKK